MSRIVFDLVASVDSQLIEVKMVIFWETWYLGFTYDMSMLEIKPINYCLLIELDYKSFIVVN